MPTNNFLQFATAVGALVESDAAYATDAARLNGFQNGIADPAHVNKVWRQGAAGTAIIGQMIVDHAGIDAVDDGNTATQKASLRAAIAQMMSGVYFGQDTSTTANTLTVALDPAPVNLTGFRSVYVAVANTNTGPATLNLAPLGAKTITRRDGSALQAGDLPVGQLVHLLYNPNLGQFSLAGLGVAEIPRVVSAATLYVRPDGNDMNDGSANDAQHAFATISGAITYGARRFYLAGGTLTIRLGVPGIYSAPGAITGANGTIAIVGDIANQSAYVIQGAGPGAGSSGLVAAYACQVQLSGLRLFNTGSINSSLNAFLGGSWTANYVDFVSNSQASNFAHMATGTGGSGFLGQACTISGGLGYAISASSGIIQIGPYATAVQGTPNFPGAFVIAGSLAAVVTTGGASFSGSATGARFYVSNLALISAGGGGANFFPGNVAGSQVNASGGYYAN